MSRASLLSSDRPDVVVDVVKKSMKLKKKKTGVEDLIVDDEDEDEVEEEVVGDVEIELSGSDTEEPLDPTDTWTSLRYVIDFQKARSYAQGGSVHLSYPLIRSFCEENTVIPPDCSEATAPEWRRWNERDVAYEQINQPSDERLAEDVVEVEAGTVQKRREEYDRGEEFSGWFDTEESAVRQAKSSLLGFVVVSGTAKLPIQTVTSNTEKKKRTEKKRKPNTNANEEDGPTQTTTLVSSKSKNAAKPTATNIQQNNINILNATSTHEPTSVHVNIPTSLNQVQNTQVVQKTQNVTGNETEMEINNLYMQLIHIISGCHTYIQDHFQEFWQLLSIPVTLSKKQYEILLRLNSEIAKLNLPPFILPSDTLCPEGQRRMILDQDKVPNTLELQLLKIDQAFENYHNACMDQNEETVKTLRVKHNYFPLLSDVLWFFTNKSIHKRWDAVKQKERYDVKNSPEYKYVQDQLLPIVLNMKLSARGKDEGKLPLNEIKPIVHRLSLDYQNKLGWDCLTEEIHKHSMKQGAVGDKAGIKKKLAMYMKKPSNTLNTSSSDLLNISVDGIIPNIDTHINNNISTPKDMPLASSDLPMLPNMEAVEQPLEVMEEPVHVPSIMPTVPSNAKKQTIHTVDLSSSSDERILFPVANTPSKRNSEDSQGEGDALRSVKKPRKAKKTELEIAEELRAQRWKLRSQIVDTLTIPTTCPPSSSDYRALPPRNATFLSCSLNRQAHYLVSFFCVVTENDDIVAIYRSHDGSLIYPNAQPVPLEIQESQLDSIIADKDAHIPRPTVTISSDVVDMIIKQRDNA